MSDTAVRYLAMLKLVPRYPNSITTTALAGRLNDNGFGVSIRSIQRDLEKLSTYFPLVVDEDVRPHQWSFERDATVEIIPALDLPAALTFELARAYLTPVLPQRALSHMEAHFKGSRKALAHDEELFGKWPERVRVINRGLSGRRPDIDPDVLEAVTEALLTERCCELNYQARNWPAPEIVTVHPYGLVFRDPNVYLIGRIDGRDGIRQLVLHRARSGIRLDEPAELPENFNLDLFIRSGAMGILKSTDPILLRIRCDKPAMNHVLEAPLGLDQCELRNTDTDFEISVTVRDTQDLRWWLIAQSTNIDILEPDWLRDQIRQELQAGLDRLSKN
ncbi:helix-turn-helix transcriptional regulator [Marinobacter sp. F4216]|uniref:helix-turn-helix transcriptional regulator n=1 Tax=Marinobacter sp. F4216 TaxID=2874281 RepID=UPI001CBF0E99|nr:WYL domain-containing protein [Marinobacter sp. F4216]MBZ2168908.1 WYL domain-containing protein [Marinobacter sp. F4216]